MAHVYTHRQWPRLQPGTTWGSPRVLRPFEAGGPRETTFAVRRNCTRTSLTIRPCSRRRGCRRLTGIQMQPWQRNVGRRRLWWSSVVRCGAKCRAWFGTTYGSSAPDLGRCSGHTPRPYVEFDNYLVVYQLRNAFGGYCEDLDSARESVSGSGTVRNPWRDGGCVPHAPGNVAASSGPGPGNLSVSWSAPRHGDGGARGRGVQGAVEVGRAGLRHVPAER